MSIYMYMSIISPLCLGNISKDFSANKMRNIGFYGNLSDFSWLWCYCSWWYTRHSQVFNEKERDVF